MSNKKPSINPKQEESKSNNNNYNPPNTEAFSFLELDNFLSQEITKKDNANKNFTLQNGKEILEPFFAEVQRLDYEDSLAVTNLDDLIEYIYSLSSMTSLSSVPKEEIRGVLGKFVVNEVLNVPKEYGMFCCRKV